MNSMFSSFDAFAAEVLGQKLRSAFSFPTINKASSGDNKAVDAMTTLKKQQQEEGSSPAAAQPSSDFDGKKKQQKPKLPRFAVELDGLNCFETFVRY
ncbi:hypothetical protein Tsubulata_007510 [Turnera subulata]|uniref:Avr9/Cf-9 rapidly elicited protein n=1 Tax=Turnera subulata TaxID=218843 RepID=A0A9Q0JEX7_9ROSI|nr:hypothetical protein Tsubulata_007510 [Turnera subulata]